MDIYCIYILFLILILIYFVFDSKNNKLKDKIKFNNLTILNEENKVNKNEVNIFVKKTNFKPVMSKKHFFNNYCQVPSLNTEQCFKSKYNECSNINGSYSQCTNNIMPKNTHALCENRTFEMTSPEKKVSQNCYMNFMK